MKLRVLVNRREWIDNDNFKFIDNFDKKFLVRSNCEKNALIRSRLAKKQIDRLKYVNIYQ